MKLGQNWGRILRGFAPSVLMVVALPTTVATASGMGDGPSHLELRFGLSRVAAFPAQPRTARPASTVSFLALGSVMLNPAARQGPATWYVGKLHIRIKVERVPAGGNAYVSVDSDERTFAQFKFARVGTRRGDSTIEWNTYGLVLGAQHAVVRGGEADIVFYNYLQDAGVKPGRNWLRLQVEQYGGARIGEVKVFPDSGIYVTKRPPAPLAVSIDRSEGTPRVNKPFVVDVRVAPKWKGDVLRGVSIVPTYDGRYLELLDPRSVPHVDTLRNTRDIRFTFKARRIGRYTIDFAATSNFNNPHVGVEIDVVSAEEGWFPDGAGRWIALAAVITGVVILAITLGKRRQRRNAFLQRHEGGGRAVGGM